MEKEMFLSACLFLINAFRLLKKSFDLWNNNRCNEISTNFQLILISIPIESNRIVPRTRVNKL